MRLCLSSPLSGTAAPPPPARSPPPLLPFEALEDFAPARWGPFRGLGPGAESLVNTRLLTLPRAVIIKLR